MKLSKKRQPSKRTANRKAPANSFAQLQREKEEARVRDWERLATGEATPEEIQRENSIFTPEETKQFRILNLEELLLGLR
jgi:hypothetical protein